MADSPRQILKAAYQMGMIKDFRECMAKTGGVPGYIEDFCHVLSGNQTSEPADYFVFNSMLHILERLVRLQFPVPLLCQVNVNNFFAPKKLKDA